MNDIVTALGQMIEASGTAQTALNALQGITQDQYNDLTELQTLTKALQQLQAKYMPNVGS